MKWIPYIIVWVKKLDELRKILLVDLLIMKQVTSNLHIATPYNLTEVAESPQMRVFLQSHLVICNGFSSKNLDLKLTSQGCIMQGDL